MVSFKSRILNVHLACTLCMGYFRNAYTITECLHTYCKECILKYFQESKKDCPTCGHDLSPYPIELIRHDRTLQSIVDKVISDGYSANNQGAGQLPSSRGNANTAFGGGKSRLGKRSTEDRGKSRMKDEEDAAAGATDAGSVELKAPAEMSFCLRWNEDEDIEGTPLKALEKPYLRTSSAISIQHLKKYLGSKFPAVQNSLHILQFSCKGTVLQEHAKVADVYQTIWKDPGVDLELRFRCTAPL